MIARNAVRRRSAGVSEAVSPANNATFPIGSIVVQIVAKSLLILINRGDMRMELRVQRHRRVRAGLALATRVGASERGQQTSFKSLLILMSSGDIFSVCGNHRRPCNLSSASPNSLSRHDRKLFLPFYPLWGSARVPRKRTINDLTSGL